MKKLLAERVIEIDLCFCAHSNVFADQRASHFDSRGIASIKLLEMLHFMPELKHFRAETALAKLAQAVGDRSGLKSLLEKFGIAALLEVVLFGADRQNLFGAKPRRHR